MAKAVAENQVDKGNRGGRTVVRTVAVKARARSSSRAIAVIASATDTRGPVAGRG